MYTWRHIPLLKFLVPFILGIYVSTYKYITTPWAITLSTVFLILLIVLHFYLKKNLNWFFIQISSVIALCLMFCMGVILTRAHSEIHYQNHFSKNNRHYCIVKIVEVPKVKEKVISLKVDVIQTFDSVSSIRTQGRANLYIARNNKSKELDYGDVLIVNNFFKLYEEPMHSSHFDFKKHYFNQGIYHQAFLDSSHWVKTSWKDTHYLKAFGYYWQSILKEIFKIHIEDPATRGVAEAVIFGYKEELDDEWLAAFSKTGTMHVLAVSGLHVGILYIFIGLILGIKRSVGYSLIFKSLIILICLFFYALLTGFSPSVSRAAIMFGTVICGKAIYRQSSIYNSLTVACFILLLINPLNIYHVGFQFSFIAVWGIIYFKDGIHQLWPETNYFLDKIFLLLSISIAAQIATFPLGLYYFHQYPSLFMLSNLMVIPCVSIILHLGIGFIIVAPFSYQIGQLFSKLIEIYIQFMANAVNTIQHIPFAFFDTVHITLIQTFILYVGIIIISVTIKYRWKFGLVLCFCCVLFFISEDWRYLQHSRLPEVVILKKYPKPILVFKSRNQATFLVSDDFTKNDNQWKYLVRPYMIANRLSKNIICFPISGINQYAKVGTIYTLGKGMVWFEGKSYYMNEKWISNPTTIKVDYILNPSDNNFRIIR